jgi:hypothetical protein
MSVYLVRTFGWLHETLAKEHEPGAPELCGDS